MEDQNGAVPSPSTTGSKPQKPSSANAPELPSKAPLTPEEQMALFEKSLKEDDWGHQPC